MSEPFKIERRDGIDYIVGPTLTSAAMDAGTAFRWVTHLNNAFAAGAASAALSGLDPKAAQAVIDAARRLVDVGRHNDAEWDAFCSVLSATSAGTERSGT